ncbi:MAG: efflux RND transporter permease subunit [Kordiimonadaceae bacterium]|nr:efflux RND transporter permease subunit [Kordiimonadaceae bacterium]
MNIARVAIEKRVITLALTLILLFGGTLAYTDLSRLEDPEFTIKEALIITPYTGATAAEVAEEVSDEIEMAVQKLGQLDEVESRSERGLSTVTVRIKDKYTKDDLPQIWDELRRKVGDIQSSLPPGAGTSIVVDDFGDVWGVFLAIHGEGYSETDIREYAQLLQRELLLVQDVAKIELYGERTEAVYIELDRDRISQMGISTNLIIRELRQKNVVVDGGSVKVEREFVAMAPSGVTTTVQDIGDILISGLEPDKQIFLKDVATVRRGYVEPTSKYLLYNGQTAVGLGISTVSGGNVVNMGTAIDKKLDELKSQTPVGMEISAISYQSRAVTTAIESFVVSLVEAVAIVIGVLIFFMGIRSSLIIGFVLILTVTGTFILMGSQGVALERISLGALVIALGMLVDNAIVVVDSVQVRAAQGIDRKKAAEDVVAQTAMPLLGATVVAVLAFAAIGTSQDSTGEFTRSLFQVVLISLMLSWATAITVTPLLCVMFLKSPAPGSETTAAYQGKFYTYYRRLLDYCIRYRMLTLGVVILVFGSSLFGFQFVDQSFFPNSTRTQFRVDYWLPQGGHIDDTLEDSKNISAYLEGVPGATNVTSLVGQGAMRFLVTYAPEKTNSSYAQFLVDVADSSKIDAMLPEIESYLAEQFPQGLSYATKFLLGPGEGGKIQVRFSGPDPVILRQLSKKAITILSDDGGAKAIRTDWRQQVKTIQPTIADDQANLSGITRANVATALRDTFQGRTVGIFREGDELLPIIFRAPENERDDVANIHNLQIWSPAARQMIPLRQVVSDFPVKFEDQLVIRLDRKPTLTVHADQKTGTSNELLARIMPAIEAMELPAGFTMEWGGEYESSSDAQAGLAAQLPFFFVTMVLIVVMLFNAVKQPLIIWLVVPLAIIGVTVGLLVTGQPFGFMALLGFMSLSGMLIKNAIVLIDQIDLEIREGKKPLQAIIDSGVSRLMPVGMAAATTALGMIPLLADAFFVSMAVTIISGLVFATVLTMVVVPVLYAVFFGIKPDEKRINPAPAND